MSQLTVALCLALGVVLGGGCSQFYPDAEDGDADSTDAAGPPLGTPCEGGVGCLCEEDSECDGGFCVESADGRICSVPCQTGGCPQGFDCIGAEAVTVAEVAVCMPRHPRLCRPCQTDADCDDPQRDETELCLPGLDPREGRFCTSSCANGTPCPAGYSCSPVTLDSGATVQQCLPTSGQCTCRDAWSGQDFTTTCLIENAAGSCPGERTCGDKGLTSCAGPAPSPEVCNGVDDDCDGTTDVLPELPCTIDNEHGSCPGLRECGEDGQICAGRPPAPETCNGIDDDCDGETDEATCSDGLSCTDDICTPDGKCVNQLTAGSCRIDGECVPEGTPNPSDPCEACLPGVSKTGWSDADGAPCNDGELCTMGDMCLGGACAGTPYACDDGQPCTEDICDGAGGCKAPLKGGQCLIDGECRAAGTLSPGNPCLACLPESATKTWFPNFGALCDDGEPCTYADTCGAGGCSGLPYDCDDGDGCTLDVCDGAQGCSHTQVTDACVIDGVCVAAGAAAPGEPCQICDPDASTDAWTLVADGGACDDGDPCTFGDVCGGGACGGTPYTCDDGLGCTSDVCDGDGGCGAEVTGGWCLVDGACVADGTVSTSDPCLACQAAVSVSAWLPRAPGSACDDGTPCTSADACDADGECAGAPYACDDGLWCTLDACDGDGGCLAQPDGGCAIEGACYAPGEPNPDTPCLVCDPDADKTGWTPANGVPCDDGDPCTSGDACGAGACAGDPYSCDDGASCTTDLCDGAGGCSHPVNGGWCFVGGKCFADGAVSPGDPCQVCSATYPDTWSPISGGACDDGDSCTEGDACSAGVCTGAPIVDALEPNDTATTAEVLPSIKDKDPFPAGQVEGTLFGPGDEDWYVSFVQDVGAGVFLPRARLTSVPAGSDYEVCVYVQCASGPGPDITCDGGAPADLDGLQGCCGDAGDDVRTDADCQNALDSSWVYYQVRHAGGAWTCGAYELEWGDDED